MPILVIYENFSYICTDDIVTQLNFFLFMVKFDSASSERKKEVFSSRYHVVLIDCNDETKTMQFDCGTDLLFFLSFVNFNLYKVLIDAAYFSKELDFDGLGLSPVGGTSNK